MTEPQAKRPTRKKPSAFKVMRGLGRGIINLGLTMWAVNDIRHRPAEEIKGQRKVWMIAAFAPPIGPIAYLVFGRKREAAVSEIDLDPIE